MTVCDPSDGLNEAVTTILRITFSTVTKGPAMKKEVLYAAIYWNFCREIAGSCPALDIYITALLCEGKEALCYSHPRIMRFLLSLNMIRVIRDWM
jgi:hypothetical protein